MSPGGGVTNPIAPQASAVTVPTNWVLLSGTSFLTVPSAVCT